MKRRKGGVFERVFQAASWTFLSAILAACVIGIMLTRLVTPESLRGLIVNELESTFHRPVQLDKVNLVLHQGVKVSNLVVQEKDEFGGGVFLSSDFLIVKFRPWALLRGRLEMSEVLLMSPRIVLSRREGKGWNFKDLLAAAEGGPRKGFSPALPPLQSAAAISIQRGVLQVRDAARQASFDVRDFSLSVDRFSAAAPFGLKMSFANENEVGGKRVNALVDMTAKVSLASEGSVDIQRLRAVIDGETVTVVGQLRNFSVPEVELRLQAPAVDSALLARYWPASGWVDVPASRWHLRAALPQALPGHAQSLRLSHFDVVAGSARLSAEGNIRFGQEDSEITIALPSTRLTELSSFYAGFSRAKPTGAISGSLTLSGPIKSLRVERLGLTVRGAGMELKDGDRVWDLDGTLSGRDSLNSFTLALSSGGWSVLGQSLTGLAADAEVRGEDLEVRRLQGRWRESLVRMAGCAMNWREPKQVIVDASVDSLSVDQLYAEIFAMIARHRARLGVPDPGDRPWAQVFKYSIPKDFPNLKGRLRVARAHSPNFTTANLVLLCDMRDISRGLSQVQGEARLEFGPGRVSNIPEVRQAHRLLNVLLLPFVYMHEYNAKTVFSLDTATPRTLDFSRNSADIVARRGVADVRYLHVNSGQFLAFSDGKVDFPKEKVGMHVLMRIPKARGQLPEKLVDTLGRPSFELMLNDDLNSPTPTLTLRKMGASEIEESLARGLARGKTFNPLADKGACGRKT